MGTAGGYRVLVTPDIGDVIWVTFSPQVGREQAGHRPAVVLTSAGYNRASGLLLCCPTTTRIKGYPYEVPLTGTPASVVLVDHVRSIDWQGRGAKHKGRVTPEELAEITAKLKTLIP